MCPQIEIVVEDQAGASIAVNEGADSMELCVQLDEGGLTPPKTLMQAVMQTIKEADAPTECHCLILNKPSQFYVSKEDLLALEQGIREAKESGATGVVFGALTPENELDTPTLTRLAAVAHPLKMTFHRAFDRIANKPKALEQLIELGFTRLLTSGKPGIAADHTAIIHSLVEQAAGRLQIIAGGGVRASNLQAVGEETGASILHMSCRTDRPDETGFKPTDPQKVREVIARCRNLGNGM